MKIKKYSLHSKLSTNKSTSLAGYGVSVWLGVGIAPWLSTDVHALGFRVPNQDAAATARGNAFVATADNPSALYYNPAGIRLLEGHNIQFGSHNISVNSEYNGAGSLHEETEFEVQPVPQLYYTLTPDKSQFSYGLGIYVPFGLGLEWPDDASFRTVAIEGRLNYMTVNPVVAWQALPTLSLAIGPTINYSKVKLRQGVGLVPGDELRTMGEGSDFGFSAGVLWQPHPKWSFGASYRSATSIDYDGHTTVVSAPVISGQVDSKAKVDFPQVVIAGISFRPTTNWNFEADVDWTDWDTLDTVQFRGTGALLGADAKLALNWQSSWLYQFGVTRYLPGGWFASTGYFFSQNSTSERYFNPVVPDTDLHVGSLGFGHRGEHWSWALTGQIITGPARTVNNSVSAPANGKYKWFNQAVNLAVGYRF